jgi:acetyl-CoA C-acetyltransferase
MGQVIQAGAGQIAARQAAVKGGVPMDVPAITINKVCLSGINAIAMADQLIRAGEHEVVVAGGMESMTKAPHLLPKSREGFKYGDTALVDSMAYDALTTSSTRQDGQPHRGHNASGAALTREEQDAFSARSHQRAALAWKNGLFDDEVVPVVIPTAQGRPDRDPGRGRARRHHRRDARRAAPGSPRKAPSRPAPPRRSPTARARSW